MLITSIEPFGGWNRLKCYFSAVDAVQQHRMIQANPTVFCQI